MGAYKDLLDEKFGRLTVIGSLGKNSKGQYLWQCLCDCGKEISVVGSYLTSSNTRSCGCLSREITSNRNKKGFINLSGKVFGYLEVIEFVKKVGTSYYWKCRCIYENCGNIKNIRSKDLTSGGTKTCGCKRKKISNASVFFYYFLRVKSSHESSVI